jgi:hypothetical protein
MHRFDHPLCALSVDQRCAGQREALNLFRGIQSRQKGA